jgi:hypothetical protein
MGHAESYITETVSVWQNNILMLLSLRNLTASNTSGTLALIIVIFIALVVLLSEFKHFVNKRLVDRQTGRTELRIAGLTQLICQILDKLLLYLVFTIAQDIRHWADNILIDGTLTPREPLSIMCIFIIIYVVYYDFTRRQTFESTLLGKLENYLPELHDMSSPPTAAVQQSTSASTVSSAAALLSH